MKRADFCPFFYVINLWQYTIYILLTTQIILPKKPDFYQAFFICVIVYSCGVLLYLSLFDFNLTCLIVCIEMVRGNRFKWFLPVYSKDTTH